MRRRFAAAAAVALLGAGAAGCGVAAGSPDTLYMSLNTDPATFDPALAKGGDDYTVARMLFDTLVRKDQGNTLAPGIASQWTAEDAAHYTFTIRNGLSCSDGSAITPSVVAASLNRFVAPKTGSTARTLALGTAKASFTADDGAHTVRATLTKPWARFPHRALAASGGDRLPGRAGQPSRPRRGHGDWRFFRSVHADVVPTRGEL